MKGTAIMRQISEISDDELLNMLKSGEHEFFTLAEAHKALGGAGVRTGIDDIRRRILTLYRDGYLGNEPTGDGVNMYFLVYCPES
jgi:hypothetical protein